MATTLKQDALLAEFSALAYNSKGEPAPAGWARIEIEEKGSFAAYAYQNNSEPNEVVIAFRGSDDKGDWVVANKDILAGKWTEQMTQAVTFAAKIEESVNAKDAEKITTWRTIYRK